RVEPALLPLGIFEAVELNGALPHTNGAEAPDPPRVAQQFALDLKAFLAVFVDDKPRPALAELRIDVFVPEIERLQNVAVGIDNIIGAGHRHFLRCKSDPAPS